MEATEATEPIVFVSDTRPQSIKKRVGEFETHIPQSRIRGYGSGAMRASESRNTVHPLLARKS
jgi:hypothetical protein